MEIICRIVEQGACTTTSFKDRQGKDQTKTFMPFVLASGADTIYAELTGEAATKCGPKSKDYYYKAELSLYAATSKTKDGEEFQKTICYLNRITVL